MRWEDLWQQLTYDLLSLSLIERAHGQMVAFTLVCGQWDRRMEKERRQTPMDPSDMMENGNTILRFDASIVVHLVTPCGCSYPSLEDLV